MSVSSHSEFINDGSRRNCGIVEQDNNKIEKNGVVVGLIGARFARPNKMEYEDIKITEEQNIYENGYGVKGTENAPPSTSRGIWQYLFSPNNAAMIEKSSKYRHLWNTFYEESDHLYSNIAIDNKRFGQCYKREEIFDNLLMKKRYAISLDLLLLEANERAKKAQKMAYIHVVGIGLGVWLAAPQQEQIFMECLQQRLKYLLAQLNNIGVVHLSWFKLTEWGDLKNGKTMNSEKHPLGGIQIFISKRNPNEKLVSVG